MYKIMLVEDDQTIAEIIKATLEKWGYQVFRTEDFQEVLGDFARFQPHLVLMDINLPYYDGYYWCGKIRQQGNIPILFISSRDTDGDKIRAIAQGGDDYIEKPFSMDLLVAKVQAALRRAYSYSDQSLDLLQHRQMILNVPQLKVYSGDGEVELTRNECRILSILLRDPGKTITRTRLMKALWDDESFVDDNTLTVNVNRLRRRLEAIGLEDYIQTIKGEGYRLV